METSWTPNKPPRPLTRKQLAFVQHLINNPKDSATKAIRATYGQSKPINPVTAAAMATENLRKPQIKLELAKHSGTAELVMLDMMKTSQDYAREGGKEGASYASVAVSAAKDILDRVHGKATQRVETRSEAVIINVDLTQAV